VDNTGYMPRKFDVLIDYLPVDRFNMLVDICQQLPAFGTWLPFSFPHLEKKSINISNSKFFCAAKNLTREFKNMPVDREYDIIKNKGKIYGQMCIKNTKSQ